MVRIDKEITVNAPLEAVFKYISQPANWPEFWPSLIGVKNIKPLPSGGYTASYEYKMAGMRLEGRSAHTEFVPNSWMVIETYDGIKSTITWTFRAQHPNETRITLTVQYTIPIPLLGKLAEAFIVDMNDKEAELVMENIKSRFTLGPA